MRRRSASSAGFKIKSKSRKLEKIVIDVLQKERRRRGNSSLLRERIWRLEKLEACTSGPAISQKGKKTI